MSLKTVLLAGVLALNVSANISVAEDGAEALSPIRMNQVGFEAAAPKRAIVPAEADAPLEWRVTDSTGAVVASGLSEPFGADEASGQAVHRIDFSQVGTPGEGYRLIVGEAESRPFTISERPWGELKRDSTRMFYQNRSGIEIEERHVERPDLARPAAHVDETLPCFSGEDMSGHVWAGCDYELNVGRGWYDAGDHGKYVVNGGISVWTLMNAHERFGAVFADGALPIPEAGNGVGDLLDETRWQMEFMLGMQAPEGARASVPAGRVERGQPLVFTEIDASGMAHHKAHDARWTPLPMAPHDDPEPRHLYPPSTAATLNLAASAAQCARLWRELDAEFSARCLEAARRAFAAAERNPEVYAVGNFNGGGGYGDGEVSDEFYWAAAELYAATGEDAYAARLRASPHFLGAPGAGVGHISWPGVGALGTITLATVETGLTDEEKARARAALVAAADRYLAARDAEGYAIPFGAGDYTWGSNGDLLNRAIILALAHDFTGEARYRTGVIDAVDYVLGRNALDQSYVTGHGARPMRNPHHRFWAHAADPAYPEPPAGVVSGGANSRNMADPVAQAMRGTCAPQACWADHIDSYAMNEVAINWNAPLVWVAGWLDQ